MKRRRKELMAWKGLYRCGDAIKEIEGWWLGGAMIDSATMPRWCAMIGWSLYSITEGSLHRKHLTKPYPRKALQNRFKHKVQNDDR